MEAIKFSTWRGRMGAWVWCREHHRQHWCSQLLRLLSVHKLVSKPKKEIRRRKHRARSSACCTTTVGIGPVDPVNAGTFFFKFIVALWWLKSHYKVITHMTPCTHSRWALLVHHRAARRSAPTFIYLTPKKTLHQIKRGNSERRIPKHIHGKQNTFSINYSKESGSV